MKRAWLLCMVLAGTATAADDPAVTFGEKRIVRSFFRPALINPDTAQWSFDSKRPDPRGTLICGHVNYQNSAKIYVGDRPFYVIIKPGVTSSVTPEVRYRYYSSTNVVVGDVRDNDNDDANGNLKARLKALCGKR